MSIVIKAVLYVFIALFIFFIVKAVMIKKEDKKNRDYIKKKNISTANNYIRKYTLEGMLDFEEEEEENNDEENKKNIIKNLSKNKGIKYELFVGKIYENKGYEVIYNGLINNLDDNSIDLIALRDDEVVLIQCKNWNEDNEFKLNHKDVKAFIGSTGIFLKRNPEFRRKHIKRILAISGRILDKSAYAYIKANQDLIRYEIIPYEERV